MYVSVDHKAKIARVIGREHPIASFAFDEWGGASGASVAAQRYMKSDINDWQEVDTAPMPDQTNKGQRSWLECVAEQNAQGIWCAVSPYWEIPCADEASARKCCETIDAAYRAGAQDLREQIRGLLGM